MAIFDGQAGDEVFTGTNGVTDELRLATSLRFAQFTIDGSGRWVVSTPEGGSDTLASVELVRFQDATVQAAVDGMGGFTRMLTGSALGDHIVTFSLGGRGIALFGEGGDDRLVGDNGNDTINGGTGNDTMEGGAGNDTYYVSGNDTIVDTDGLADTAIGTASFSLHAGIEIGRLEGTASANLTGNGLDNVLWGNTAANFLDGGAGGDDMRGGAGDDTYVVGDTGDNVTEALNEGTDTVLSSVSLGLWTNIENLYLTGNNAIDGTGNWMDNLLVGNDAANVLDGASGADTLMGGAGNDTYVVTAQDSVVERSGEGVDNVRSSTSWELDENLENLELTGGGNANGTGNDAANVLYGNSGSNILDGQGGADTMNGGDGGDTYIVDSTADLVQDSGSTGVDQVRTTAAHTLGWGLENLTLLGTSGLSGTGNSQDNVIRGNSGSNRLAGGGGNDLIYGGAGNDSLDGRDAWGFDTLVGGIGNDTYLVTDSYAADVRELAGQGTDTVQATVTTGYTLGAQLENLVLIGGDVYGVGNTLNNRIYGTAGANRLDGGAGADVMSGGNGSDVYIVDSASDVVVESVANLDADEVISSVTLVLAKGVENGTLSGSASNSLTGQELNNRLVGNTGNNRLRGDEGLDLLSGGAGNDTLEGGNDNDRLMGSAGNDVLNGGAGVDIADYRATGSGVTVDLNRTTAQATGGSGSDTLLGIERVHGSQVGADRITGTAGANVLRGLGGNDTLTGGGGTDKLYGDDGEDFIHDATGNSLIDGGAGFDTLVYSSVAGSVSVRLDDTGPQATGAAGKDTIRNIEGLIGSQMGNDFLGGDFEDNVLRGEGGNDTLAGGDGNDTLTGGAGTDVADYSESVHSVRVDLTRSGAQDTQGAGTDTLVTIEGIIGSAWGNDHLIGNSGANYLNGSGGADTMVGGQGADTYVVDSAFDRVIETSTSAGEIDKVVSSVSFTLGANLEHLTLNGTGAVKGTGNAAANFIVGNTGANTISGAAGNDTLAGAGGADVLAGGTGQDAFRFHTSLSSARVDRITDFVAADDRIELDNAVFKALGSSTGTLAAGAFVVGTAARDTSDRIVYNNATGALYYDADGSGAGAAVQIATLTGVPTITAADIVVI